MSLTRLQRQLLVLIVIVLGIIDYFIISYYDANLLELNPRIWCDDKSSLQEVISCVDDIYQNSSMLQIWQQNKNIKYGGVSISTIKILLHHKIPVVVKVCTAKKRHSLHSPHSQLPRMGLKPA